MESIVRVDPCAIFIALDAHSLDVDGVEHDVRAAQTARHLFEKRQRHRAAVARVAVDTPDVACRGLIQVFLLLSAGVRVASSHQPWVKAFREEDHLFAAGKNAKRAAEIGEKAQLALDARPVELIVLPFLTECDIKSGIAAVGGRGSTNRRIGRNHLRDAASAGDAQRVR